MARMIKLTSFRSNEHVLINPDEMVKVQPAERGTTIVYMRGCPSEHVMESLSEIERMLMPPAADPTLMGLPSSYSVKGG